MNYKSALAHASATTASVRSVAIRLGVKPSIQAGSLAIFGQCAVSAANFITTVIIGRMCSQTELGVYSLALSVLTVALALETAFISAPYTVLRHRFGNKTLSHYSSGTFALFGGLVLFLTACAAALAILSTAGVLAPDSTSLLWTITAVQPFHLAYTYAHFKAYAHLQVGRGAMIDATRAVIQIVSLLAFARIGMLSASTAFLCLGLACGVPGVTWLIHSWNGATFSKRGIRYTWTRNLQFGRWLFASDTLSRLRLLVPFWLVASTIGTAYTGTYAALFSLVCLINPLMIGFGSYFSPRTAAAFATGGSASLVAMMNKAITFMGIALIAYCIVMLLLGVPAVAFLYGDRYSGQGVTIMVMTLSRCLGIIANLMACAFNAVHRPDIHFRSNLLGIGIMIAVSLVLVSYVELLGVAIGSLMGDAAMVAFMYVSVRSHLVSET